MRERFPGEALALFFSLAMQGRDRKDIRKLKYLKK